MIDLTVHREPGAIGFRDGIHALVPEIGALIEDFSRRAAPR